MANDRERVWFGKSRLINLGSLDPQLKYENINLELGDETFVEPGETKEQAYQRVKKWVTDKLDEEETSIRNQVIEDRERRRR